jgi:hypothetical protein
MIAPRIGFGACNTGGRPMSAKGRPKRELALERVARRVSQ